MNTDRTLDLATAPKQVPQREMGFDRITVDLEHLDEGVDRLVGLFVQEVVEPTKIDRTGFSDTGLLWFALTAARSQPARGRRKGKQQKEEFLHPINAPLWASYADFSPLH